VTTNNDEHQGASKSTGWSEGKSQWVSVLIALAAAVITIGVVIPLIKRKAVRDIREGRVLESEKSATTAAVTGGDPMQELNGKHLDPESGVSQQEHAPVHAATATTTTDTAPPAQVFSADAEKEEAKTGLALYLSKAKNQAMKGV
jgi:cytoskeletal protein RodZ